MDSTFRTVHPNISGLLHHHTSWQTDDEKVTIGDVVDYLGDKTIDINVLELSQQLPPLPTRGAERVADILMELA